VEAPLAIFFLHHTCIVAARATKTEAWLGDRKTWAATRFPQRLGRDRISSDKCPKATNHIKKSVSQ